MILVSVNHLQVFTLDGCANQETETIQVIHDDSLLDDVMTI